MGKCNCSLVTRRAVLSAAILTAASPFWLAQTAKATDGSWATFASGTWSDPANWASGTIADGVDSTASFVADDNSGTVAAITLDTSRTVGNLIFGDTQASLFGGSAKWQLSGPGTLTLQTTTGTPTITLQPFRTAGEGAVLSAPLAGSQGVNITAGDASIPYRDALTLSDTGAFTGGTMTIDGVDNTTITTAAALNGLSGFTFANTTGQTGSNSNNLTFNGNITVGAIGETWTLQSGIGIDRRIAVQNQSGFKVTWAGNLTAAGDSAITLTTAGATGGITINGSVDATAMTNAINPLVLRGTSGTGTINGNIKLNSTVGAGVIAKTDGALWVFNSSSIDGYRLAVAAGTLRVTNPAALSSNIAISTGQRPGVSDLGIFETNGTFTRSLGLGPGQIGSSCALGLGAGGGPLTVDLDGGTGTIQFAPFTSNTLQQTGFTSANGTGTLGTRSITLTADPASLGIVVGNYVTYGPNSTQTPWLITGISGNTITTDYPINANVNNVLYFFHNTQLNDVNLFLNSTVSTDNLTFQNGLDLNGHDRVITVGAKTATISGNIINTGATLGGLQKAGVGTLELTGANTYNDGTAVNNGILLIGNPAALGTGTVSINTAGTISGTIKVEPGLAGPVTLSNLVIGSAAKMDLTTGKIAIQYAAAGLTSPAANVLTYIRNAYHAGAWDLPGLTSSSITPTNSTALGYYDDGSQVTVKYTWYGDLNLDGRVNGDDYALLDQQVAKFGLGAAGSWVNGDVNYDGVVDANDYLLTDQAFAAQTGTLSPSFLAQREAEFGDAYVSSLLASVPEPTSFCFVAAALMTISARRRRHSYMFTSN
ncbi:MAG TPA: autotransporter-associated beta strand repeat-containing protein [Tepidisphaeraceae bacterium]|jgi:autotransporter-associated beta strand protein|nr:autotransporter-associated beta strand repeat-containing protein [Tepidisphaeraceae bacterium]